MLCWPRPIPGGSDWPNSASSAMSPTQVCCCVRLACMGPTTALRREAARAFVFDDAEEDENELEIKREDEAHRVQVKTTFESFTAADADDVTNPGMFDEHGFGKGGDQAENEDFESLPAWAKEVPEVGSRPKETSGCVNSERRA